MAPEEISMDLQSAVYHASDSSSDGPTDRTLDSVLHTHFFTDKSAFSKLVKSISGSKGNSLKVGGNIRFEIFELNGKHFVRSTLDGEKIDFSGSKNGVIELNTFLRTIYPKLFFGGIQDVCVGQEDPESGEIIPSCARGSYVQVVRQVQRAPVVERRVVSRPKVVEKCRMEEVVVPVVEKCETTVEHRVEIPLRPPPPPPRTQVVVEKEYIDRPVPFEVKVPVVEEKVVVHEVEKLVTEAPTHIHHIEIESPDQPAAIPPVQFHEEIDEGWPWWLWLLPLLCCIPILAWL
jgi:hypothetical protein